MAPLDKQEVPLPGFMKLTQETRNQIFGYLMVDEPVLCVSSITIKRGIIKREKRYKPHPLTQTSRAIRAQTLPMFYGLNYFLIRINGTKFNIAPNRQLNKWLRAIGPEALGMVRHVICYLPGDKRELPPTCTFGKFHLTERVLDRRILGIRSVEGAHIRTMSINLHYTHLLGEQGEQSSYEGRDNCEANLPAFRIAQTPRTQYVARISSVDEWPSDAGPAIDHIRRQLPASGMPPRTVEEQQARRENVGLR